MTVLTIHILTPFELLQWQGEESGDTQLWFRTLQFYTQSLGGWRKRRKGLANIMIDPNVAASVDNTYYLEAEEEGRRRSR